MRFAVFDKADAGLHFCKPKRLISLHTAHAKGGVFRHSELGHILEINGEIQHVEAWAPLYHEPLVHLAAAFVPKIASVLVLGGGSFFAAAEILKYKSVRQVVMIDHDHRLLREMIALYPHAAKSVEDQRLIILRGDVIKRLSTLTERFDLIVNDAIDLTSVKHRNMFKLLANLLKPTGVCSDVVYRHVFERKRITRTVETLHDNFHSVFSLICVPEYPGILHLLTIWGRNPRINQSLKHPINREQRRWMNSHKPNECVYFDPKFLSYYLHLPKYLRQIDPTL